MVALVLSAGLAGLAAFSLSACEPAVDGTIDGACDSTTMATVANAIKAATGVRMTSLPMSPPKVLAKLSDA